ncbi:hypothetical protein WJX81_000487 [Elliptochloris bilobata]|uniref:Methyltransferase domain-containing protein n=1 Tax=Elliptochloris bilobata TaxID=381761 RepID=A0AAW1RQZ4_9CHLO
MQTPVHCRPLATLTAPKPFLAQANGGRRGSGWHRERLCPSCAAAVQGPLQKNRLLFAAVEALFSFQPFFALAAKQAKNKIAQRGRDIGVDISAEVAALAAGADWEAELEAVQDASLAYPAYYTQPFHAYPAGNLCWEAALEVNSVARAVHAPVMDPSGRAMDPGGDAALRAAFSGRLRELMGEERAVSVRDIVDCGCATGLSTLELRRRFPDARSLTGVDLSPHFLAVARVTQRRREEAGGAHEPLTFVHAAAEATGMPAASADLVTACLACHELPAAATREMLAEARRILRPGGAMAIMEMDPASAAFQRVFGNPFAYAAFKSTEPWLLEYAALDVPGALREAGFVSVRKESASPRHFTVVAFKPK